MVRGWLFSHLLFDALVLPVGGNKNQPTKQQQPKNPNNKWTHRSSGDLGDQTPDFTA